MDYRSIGRQLWVHILKACAGGLIFLAGYLFSEGVSKQLPGIIVLFAIGYFGGEYLTIYLYKQNQPASE